jgi:RNA polymerase sigma-70 factor (ECF subfamily)
MTINTTEVYAYDEMPYEEMSKVLSTSVGALKASYHFAAKKIEEILVSH